MQETSRIRIWAIAAVLELGSFGCRTMGEARYVYQDGEFGVVGIPEGTSRWPHYYRQQAERLMAEHFPEGFEIIRVEEVVEGSRTLTTGGSLSAELTPSLPVDVLAVGKLGHTATHSRADTLKIKECRIIYRKAPPGISGRYAAEAGESPTLYIDPNDAERRALAARGAPSEKKGAVEGPQVAATPAAR
jgi:hypothetical protein